MRTRDVKVFSMMIDCADAVRIGVNSFSTVQNDCVVTPGGFEQLIHNGDIFLCNFITVVML